MAPGGAPDRHGSADERAEGRRAETPSKVAAVRAAREIPFGKRAVKEEWDARLLTEEPLEPLAERFAVLVIVETRCLTNDGNQYVSGRLERFFRFG